MSKLTLIILLLLCTALVILPLWGSLQGFGGDKVSATTNKKSGSIRYTGSRGWSGGGRSYGK